MWQIVHGFGHGLVGPEVTISAFVFPFDSSGQLSCLLSVSVAFCCFFSTKSGGAAVGARGRGGGERIVSGGRFKNSPNLNQSINWSGQWLQLIY